MCSGVKYCIGAIDVIDRTIRVEWPIYVYDTCNVLLQISGSISLIYIRIVYLQLFCPCGLLALGYFF